MAEKEKNKVFKVKDISNDGVIKKVVDYSEPIKIKTETEKYIQNKNFIKTNELKENSYKEKIIEKKETTNNSNNLNTLKNNRRSLSSRVLKGSEYALDQLLSGHDGNLGIDTIIKSKIGLKASARLTKKNLEIGKRVGKKVYKVATSENAKSFYAGTINMSQKAYEKTMDISTKVYVRQKVNSYLKANGLKERQKKELKKKINKKAKEKIKNATYMLASKVKDVLTSLLTKKFVLVGFIIITLIVTLISAIVGITSLFAYSVNLSLDDNVTMITEYIRELDYNINSRIDKAPQDYPYVDNFIYNVPQRAETNQEQVYAYLKAKYEDEKISETVIKGEIRQIHNNLYNLIFDETTNTLTETLETGEILTHTTITMTITLKTKSFMEFYEENKDSLLKENQQRDYENILKLMKENVGKILNNPFPKIDWRKYVTSEYGDRTHPITGEISSHTGIDIAMERGTKIHSCMSGVVHTFNDGDSGFGLYMTITNGNYKTLYAHCNKILVKEGDKVNAGDIIAEVGSTGLSTGGHLHLEYFVKDIRKNPRVYLKIYEE